VVGAAAILDGRVASLVAYRFVPYLAPRVWPVYVLPVAAAIAVGVCIWLSRRRPVNELPVPVGRGGPHPALPALAAALVPLAAWFGSTAPPPNSAGPSATGDLAWWPVCLAITGIVWSIRLLRTGGASSVRSSRFADIVTPIGLAVAIVASTVYHAATQHNFWQHFMLGYGDFGFYVAELEQCLPWKEVGTGRLADTGMAYHAIPLFYLLLPFYAVCRSPVFLMVVGPLFVNLPAAAFYWLVRRRTGSALAGLGVGLAWLLLPSVSRLPYANTYGFQVIYLALPFIALTIAFAHLGHWRWSCVCLVLAVLCKETACGFALGWGIYAAVVLKRRRAGLVIAVAAVVYAALAIGLIAPAFAGAGQRSRVELFGVLGAGEVLARLARPRVWLFILTLLAPLAAVMGRHWRLALAALPTLLLVSLIQEPDYLNLKYWHHSSILPALFGAAALGVSWRGTNAAASGVTERSSGRGCGTGVLALLIGVALSHQLFGFSPLAQAHRQYAADPVLQAPDPRLAVVEHLRARLPKHLTIVASERLAAHFTDYRRVQSLSRIAQAPPPDGWDLAVLDRRDTWDPVMRQVGADAVGAQLIAVGYRQLLATQGIEVYLLPHGGSSP